MEINLQHAELIRAAGRAGSRSYAAVSFAAMHVRYLLTELGVRGDVVFLATALLAPLEMVVLVQQTRIEQIPLDPHPARLGRPRPPGGLQRGQPAALG